MISLGLFYVVAFLFDDLYCVDLVFLHCVSKNDTDVAHYNFNAHQPISLIFGIDIAE